MSEVDIPRQTGSGSVCLRFAMSVDGYVAGPEHSMDFLSGATSRPSLIREYIDSMGAVLAGRDGSTALSETPARTAEHGRDRSSC